MRSSSPFRREGLHTTPRVWSRNRRATALACMEIESRMSPPGRGAGAERSPAGSLSIGVYPGEMKTFPIGTAAGKNLTVNMGNCHHRKYIPPLLDLVQGGTVDPAEALTQRERIMDVIDAYVALDTRKPGWIKVELRPAA